MLGRDAADADKLSRPVLAVAALRLQSTFETAGPWQLRLFAFAAGLGSVLAMPPFHFWPVLWLTLPALLVAVDAATRSAWPPSRFAHWRRWPLGRAGEIGWWFGFGYHLAGLFWIGEAFLVEAEVFAWLLPFAVTLLPAGLAVFMALATASAAAMPIDRLTGRGVALAITLSLAEWLRGHVLTGFPWNVLGTALTAPLALMQSVALVGIYGLTVIAVIVFAVPFAMVVDALKGKNAPRAWPAALLAVGPLLIMWGLGAWRLADGVQPVAAQPRVRLVQLSIPQRDRLDAANLRSHFDRHLAMSLTAPDGHIDDAAGVDVIVWPEAAMPFLPLAQPIALEAIGAMLPEGTTLVSGALRLETDAAGRRSVFNSLLAFDRGAGTARLVGGYDKLHLVPFGEYLPMQGLLEAVGLQQLTRQRGGFTAGEGPRKAIAIPGLGEVLPLICYEVIFPEVAGLNRRTDLVLTITNDGWFGNTTGPRQHYHQARIRAVEFGIPMIRASSNGISALIDGNGREIGRLELNAVGTLDVVPPKPLPATPYARWGDRIYAALLALLASWLMLWRRTVRNVPE